MQIAAHEESFGLDNLYKLCEITRKAFDPLNIGRIIARPFIGVPGKFSRTAHRKDFSMLPSTPMLLDKAINDGCSVFAVGKVADIFANIGISKSYPAKGNEELFDTTLKVLQKAEDKSIIFTNLSDFDTEFGHRRDVTGYAHALEQIDKRLVELEENLLEDDCVIITADHGCDPTFKGTDHTKEHVPVLMFGPKIKSRFIGRRETMADIGQTVANFLDIEPLDKGVSFL